MKPASRAEIIREVLEHIDDTNYHQAGGNWMTLNDLIDRPGQTYGTLAEWVCVIGCATHGLPCSDRYEELAERCPAIAREMLGISEAEFDRLADLPLSKLRFRLRVIAALSQAAA